MVSTIENADRDVQDTTKKGGGKWHILCVTSKHRRLRSGLQDEKQHDHLLRPLIWKEGMPCPICMHRQSIEQGLHIRSCNSQRLMYNRSDSHFY